MASDSHPPPPDLSVPAARAAATHYRGALARGTAEPRAWQDAVELFALHHPAWPLPLAEREAARIVGALIGWERGPLAARPAPPAALVRRLSSPTIPASPAGRAFRGLSPLAGRSFPIPARLPVLKAPWASPMPAPSPDATARPALP